ncbi:ABC transporter ATP-binding protein [Nonomuraea glycinis]|uniref:ABC transporter ATP-binding protein n=1 Tax=Nonomuraea glycinis TaxID=2047744 RepID=UPI002E0DEC0D|nr:ABC transporter ATP-binding protein [Nonomuraea glycinis]
MTTLLELSEVSKHFGGMRAVDGVSFGVQEGEIYGLIGPNGAGKTTVVNLISGYLTPTAGRISVAGTDVVNVRPHRLAAAGVARTYQNLQLFDESTVLENVLIGRHLSFRGRRWQMGRVRRREEAEQHEVARRLIDRVGLTDVIDVDVTELSYGMRRRVEIARAMATEPKLLLLDEPTAGMTRTESDDIGELIRAVNAEGVTVLLVDHNVRLVTEVCHRVIVLDWGKVLTVAGPTEVWQDERVKTAYLGTNKRLRSEASDAGS